MSVCLEKEETERLESIRETIQHINLKDLKDFCKKLSNEIFVYSDSNNNNFIHYVRALIEHKINEMEGKRC